MNPKRLTAARKKLALVQSMLSQIAAVQEWLDSDRLSEADLDGLVKTATRFRAITKEMATVLGKEP